MKTKFEFKHVADDEPLINDPFYAWLPKTKPELEKGKPWPTYLQSLGFDKEKHFVGQEELKTLQYVLETWFTNTPWFEPCSLEELFTGKPELKNATPKLRKMIAESGFIYDVSPDTCYIAISGDSGGSGSRLFANYQFILGGRYLCKIKEN